MMAIGLDVHKIRTTVACLNLETQEMGRPYSVPTDQLARHLSELPGDKRMVLEAGSISVFVARELESCGLDVIVVDAFKAHRLLEGRRGAKTDKLDARGLAWLLGGGLLEAASGQLKAGAAFRAVNPTKPAATVGHRIKRLFTNFYTDIRLQALVLEDENRKRLVWMGCDFCAVHSWVADRIRKQIHQKYGKSGCVKPHFCSIGYRFVIFVENGYRYCILRKSVCWN